MTSHQPPDPARSFGGVARAYDRGRPGYPRQASDWLVGGSARTVLELGAGTGKLTEQLVAAGHDVHACDPDEGMLTVLRHKLPDVRTSQVPAEEVEVPDRSVDVVVCAASFHWFDTEAVLPVIARALKPGGHLALVWNERDERIPWVRRLGRLLDGPVREQPSSHDLLVHSPLFSFVEETTYKAWQDINRETIRDLAMSRSAIATMDPEARESRLAEVVAFYEEYGRGMDGMQVPYLVRCLRTQVVHQPELFLGADGEPLPVAEQPEGAEDDARAEERRARSQDNFRSDGTDTDMLLIDFR